MNVLNRKLISGLSILLLLVASVRVALWGAGDAYARSAQNRLEYWSKTRHPLTVESFDRIESALLTARRLDGDNADVLDDLGRIAELKAFHLSLPDDDISARYLQALSYYRQSATHRPTWPYTWANIAGVKFKLGQYDAEFFHAIERATTLGPWEPAVQLVVADIGLGAWDHLPESTRALVTADIKRASKRYAASLAQIARQHGRSDFVSKLADG